MEELLVVRVRRFWKDGMSPGLGRGGSVAVMDSRGTRGANKRNRLDRIWSDSRADELDLDKRNKGSNGNTGKYGSYDTRIH